MRQVSWIGSFVLAAALLAGCSDSKSASTRRLSSAIDEAQRLYAGAVALESQPPVLDLSKQPPQLPSVDKKLVAGKVAAASQPVEDKRVSESLDKAAKTLKEAISSNPSASDGVKSGAAFLLGQVEQALAQHYVILSLQWQDQAGVAARQALLLARAASGRADLAELPQAIAKSAQADKQSPMDEIKTLRESAQRDVDESLRQSQQIQEQVKVLDEQNQSIVQQNEGLVTQAAQLRDKGEATGGAQGLEMLKQAAKIEHTITTNSSQVAANQQKAKSLLTELQMLNERLTSDKSRLESMVEFERKVQEQGGKMAEVAKAFADEAVKEFAEAAKASDEAANYLKQAGDCEKKAETNLQDAVKRLAEAEKLTKSEMSAAAKAMQEKPGVQDDILTSLTNEQHAATVTASKADAELALADLYSRQVYSGKVYAGLADTLSQVAARVKQPAPASVASLQQYVKDPAALIKSAESNYAAAEKDLDGIVRSGLRNSPAKTTLWMFQGMLARAYLGHYRLTGDATLVQKASEMIAKAVEGKEFSPYLAPVLQLRQISNEITGTAGPAATSKPSSKPAASAPASAPSE